MLWAFHGLTLEMSHGAIPELSLWPHQPLRSSTSAHGLWHGQQLQADRSFCVVKAAAGTLC